MADPQAKDPDPNGSWPELTLSQWESTRYSLQLWFQIVGKVRLAYAPMTNHWWQVPLYIDARGLTTSLIHADRVGVEIQFDFIGHHLDINTTEGESRKVAFESCSVADFYGATLAALKEVGVEVSMLARPVERAQAVPFPEDTQPRDYDRDAARRFWLSLVQASRVMEIFRARFIGKVSPVHFFWGAADLAVTRFSGRSAPPHPGGVPNCADWVQQMAYSHEVSSCGFWPGGSDEGSFYAYAYPAPAGFADWPIQPASAYFDQELGEFVLPYRYVRQADDPDSTLLSFFQSSYEAAATFAAWDRASLEADSDGIRR